MLLNIIVFSVGLLCGWLLRKHKDDDWLGDLKLAD
jgi:hypothetical protein